MRRVDSRISIESQRFVTYERADDNVHLQSFGAFVAGV
jgi:hypothetical protein